MVVAPPAGAVGRVDLEHGVNDLKRVNDERVVGAADAIADELEEAGVDNLAGLEVGLFAGLPVVDVDHAGWYLRVVEGLAFGRRTDAHVVVWNLGQQDARGGGGPLVQVCFDPVGVVAEEVGEVGKLLTRDV